MTLVYWIQYRSPSLLLLSDRNLTILIIGVFLAGFLIYFIGIRQGDNSIPVETDRETVKEEKKKVQVRLIMTGCSRFQDRTEVRGDAINTGDVPVGYIRARAVFRNDGGVLLETTAIQVLGTDPLQPGETVQFKGVSTARNVGRCNIELMDYWP